MQCSCGGSTKLEAFERVGKKDKQGNRISLPIILELDTCTACGRVGRQRLYEVRGKYNFALVAQKS